MFFIFFVIMVIRVKSRDNNLKHFSLKNIQKFASLSVRFSGIFVRHALQNDFVTL